MATRKKTGTKQRVPAIEQHASHLLEEAEKAGESVIAQVRRLFDGLAQKVSGTTHQTPSTAPEASAQTSDAQPAAEAGVIDHVRDAGEASIRVISDGFDSVRRRIVERVSASARTAARKKAAGKKAAGKKAAGKKAAGKKTAGKKAAGKKATPARGPSAEPASSERR